MVAEVRHGKPRRAGRKSSRQTRISAKNQVTIPVAVLREAGLQAGEDVEFTAVAPGVFEVRRHTSRFGEFVGILDGVDVDIEGLRNEWSQRDQELWHNTPWDED